MRALFALVLLARAVPAQTTLAVVSAASYQNTIASDSLAAIFGANLARATAFATLDASGQLPTELAATRVEVNGMEARLIYVSPGQINFVVPSGIAAGTTAVLVRSTDTGAGRTTAVQIAVSAPAIFSSDASGRGPGAILNAVTFRPAPFVVLTPDNGADTRTRLAVYGTGFRHATNVTAAATDSSSNRLDLTVEFAGAAPGFFGLDQLNFIVPAQLDGAGIVSLTISTEDGTSNSVTFQMNLLPAGLLQLAGVALTPRIVVGGDTMTATVSLNGVARAGGFPVALGSSNLVAQVAPAVTIPEGKASADAVVRTITTSGVQTGSIVAQSGGIRLTADFEVGPPNQVQLSSLTITPDSGLGGRSLSGTVALAGPAPAGAVNVQLTSDSPAVRPPAIVVVPFHEGSADFTMSTVAVTSEQNATISATLGRSTVSAKVKLLPPVSLAIEQATITAGASVNATVTLGEASPVAGAPIVLGSSDSTIARVPAFITIAAGQTTGTFSITTSQTPIARTVTISASYGGMTQRQSITLNPVGAAILSGLSISPDHVAGGIGTQGTVTLSGAAGPGGLIVNLQSSLLTAAQVPGFVIVPQGQSSVGFNISTMRVVATQTVTITAGAAGVTKTATLTVN